MIGKIVEIAIYCIMALAALCILGVIAVLVSEAWYEISNRRQQKRKRERK